MRKNFGDKFVNSEQVYPWDDVNNYFASHFCTACKARCDVIWVSMYANVTSIMLVYTIHLVPKWPPLRYSFVFFVEIRP